MAITITIQGKNIDFPQSAESPNWAPAIVEFAQAVEEALGTLTNPFDVAAQVQNIDGDNPGTDVDITALNFSTSDVVSVEILYGVVRSTTTEDVVEGGTIYLNYNAANPTGNKWEIDKDFKGDGKIDFNITDAGQMQFTTTALGGLNHTGFITFRAQTVLSS